MLEIAQKLERLSALYAEREALAAQKQELVDQGLPPEIKTRLEEIEAEFATKDEGAAANIEALEEAIKQQTLAFGEGVKEAVRPACRLSPLLPGQSGRLGAVKTAPPEVLQFR